MKKCDIKLKITKKANIKVSFNFLIVVFTFSFLIFNFNITEAALLYLDPNNGNYGVGDTFIVNVRIDNEGECINVVDARVRYDSNTIKAVDFSRGSSILSLWISDPIMDNERGEVSFSGGIPGGYCGRINGDPALSNILGRIVFSVHPDIANRNGVTSSKVEILRESQVFLNDGFGTPANVVIQDAVFAISPEVISSRNEWLEELKEDTIPPEAFKVRVDRDESVYDGKYYAVFSTTDKQSGLDYFEIFEKGSWRRAISPYLLNDQSPSDVRVRAMDKVGNERMGEYVAEENSTLPKKNQAIYLIIFIIIGIIISAVLYKLDNKLTPKAYD